LTTPGVTGLVSATLEFTFDPSFFTVQSVTTGSLTAGWITDVVANNGTVRVSIAGTLPVTGAGSLAILNVTGTGAIGAQTPLTWASASLNDGAIPRTFENGSFTINNIFDVSGNVAYFTAARAVSGVTMTLDGGSSFSQQTDAAGAFHIASVPSDFYTLTPSKSGAETAGSISALDASYALQSDSGRITLTPEQQLAADVNASGAVTAFDASLILQHAAGLIPIPFPGAGKSWAFSPSSRTYAPLDSPRTAQSFTAVLIGDPTGNWNSGGTAPNPSVVPPAMTLDIRDAGFCSSPNVSIPVDISGVSGNAALLGGDLVISYDPAKVTLADVRPGPAAAGWMLAKNLATPGEAHVALAGSTPLSATGTLLFLDVTEGAAGTSSIAFSSGSLNEGAIAATLQNGSVAVCLHGDVNGDGLITGGDLFYLVNFIRGGLAPVGAGDVNGDGFVNDKDVESLQRFLQAGGPAPK
jgi:hypothetical protein